MLIYNRPVPWLVKPFLHFGAIRDLKDQVDGSHHGHQSLTHSLNFPKSFHYVPMGFFMAEEEFKVPLGQPGQAVTISTRTLGEVPLYDGSHR